MPFYIDVKTLNSKQRHALSVMVKNWARREKSSQRLTMVRFDDNGLGGWECLRAVQVLSTKGPEPHVRYAPVEEYVSGEMWHPGVSRLSSKQKLSTREKMQLRSLKAISTAE
jgi:hypothetical protein